MFLNSSFEVHHTYLIVLKYTFIKGDNNDESSLYVFQNGIPDQEPSMPDLVNIFGPDFTAQSFVYLINNYAQTGLGGIDLYDRRIAGRHPAGESSVKAIANLRTIAKTFTCKRHFGQPLNPVRHIAQIEYYIQQRGCIHTDYQRIRRSDIRNTMWIWSCRQTQFYFNPINLLTGLYFCKITTETERNIFKDLFW